jgi:hypothetical protein
MPRPRKPQPTRKIHLTLDEDLRARVDLELFSLIEGRVPYGAWTGLVEQLLREWLAARKGEGNAQAPV